MCTKWLKVSDTLRVLQVLLMLTLPLILSIIPTIYGCQNLRKVPRAPSDLTQVLLPV